MELTFQNIYIGEFRKFPVSPVFYSAELQLQVLLMQTNTGKPYYAAC